VEVLLTREVLTYQSGADDLAILLDEAAVGMARENHLREAGDGAWVGEAAEQREEDKRDDGRPQVEECRS
jgi:hypothetical protein